MDYNTIVDASHIIYYRPWVHEHVGVCLEQISSDISAETRYKLLGYPTDCANYANQYCGNGYKCGYILLLSGYLCCCFCVHLTRWSKSPIHAVSIFVSETVGNKTIMALKNKKKVIGEAIISAIVAFDENHFVTVCRDSLYRQQTTATRLMTTKSPDVQMLTRK